ncbi:MAG: lysostaphin resistance A-like protein [Verrucomicrobiales bacterium]
MNAASQAIFTDTFNFALLLLAIGLVGYALLRRSGTTLAFERAGNVWTTPFSGLDLIVVVLLILAFRAMALHYTGPSPDTTYTPASILQGSFLFVILAGCLLLALGIRRVPFSELFGLNRLGAGAMTAWIVLGVIGCIAITQGAAWLWKHHVLTPEWLSTGDQTAVRLLRESPDLGLRLAIAIVACVLQPVTEEVIFRGYVYPAIKRHTDRPFAALVSAIVFAALHFHVPTLGPLFVFGLLLVISYELSGSLWVPIGIHALFNTTTVVLQVLPQ